MAEMSAKVLIEVTAGVIVESPMEQYTRVWAITSQELDTAEGEQGGLLLAERNGQAAGYAQALMLQPDRLNWVRLDWIWV